MNTIHIYVVGKKDKYCSQVLTHRIITLEILKSIDILLRVNGNIINHDTTVGSCQIK